MKIVVLDGFALNPGDLGWDDLRQFGELEVYDRTPADQILARSADADILLTNKVVLNQETLKLLPKLKFVCVLATGYNVIDTGAAGRLGIIVTNIPAYSTRSVAQMTFALILEFCHHVQKHSDSVMKGRWAHSIDFTYSEYPLIELASKTLGIIGFGNIGKKVSEIAMSFGMEIIVSGRTKKGQLTGENIRWAELPELLANSDFVSVHCPLTSETAGLININNLKLMKQTAFLINTSRGPIVVEKDLADALNDGIIAGAGLDVLSVEPPLAGNPLFKARNCIITPHIAWATKESRLRLMHTAVENIRAFLSGSPINVVG